jgi:uncharacterized membrane protein YkvA (DUF1232 family)
MHLRYAGKSNASMGKRLTSIARLFRQELRVYRLVLKDKRTPWLAKVLLGAAIAYTLMPIDIIPDFIPILGHLDDLVIVPVLVVAGLKLIPKEVVDDARNAVKLTNKGIQHGNSEESGNTEEDSRGKKGPVITQMVCGNGLRSEGILLQRHFE